MNIGYVLLVFLFPGVLLIELIFRSEFCCLFFFHNTVKVYFRNRRQFTENDCEYFHESQNSVN